MPYRKNPITNQIIELDVFGKEFSDWTIPTDAEFLQEAKTAKIVQLKLNRDLANTQPMVSHQGEELIEENGEFTRTGKNVYFSFKTKPTDNPATEPSSICFGAVLASINNPSHYTRYSCTIIEHGGTRKGYVALNGETASSLMVHAEKRNTHNIFYTNTKEVEINACTTIEELNSINIEF